MNFIPRLFIRSNRLNLLRTIGDEKIVGRSTASKEPSFFVQYRTPLVIVGIVGALMWYDMAVRMKKDVYTEPKEHRHYNYRDYGPKGAKGVQSDFLGPPKAGEMTPTNAK